MSKKIVLLLGVHNHQPVGNFEHVFEKAYRDAYEPFLKIIYDFPEIKFSLHYSGCLLEWFEKRHPEIFQIISCLVRRGQVSLISGGFYEPILPLIPIKDSREQINALNNYLKEKFDFSPRGFWLTERVWEPGVPEIIAGTGLEYTMLDDAHFLRAGLKRDEISGVFITEDRGNILKIFPIDKKLRYLIPFRLPDETISYLKDSMERGVEVVALADDGEKFGLWPGTKKWVYDEGWLVRFLEAIKKCGFIETLTFEEYLDRKNIFKRVYLPAASYDEMMEWSGGFFRNFFSRYPEANNLYSKMLYVSNKVANACRRKEKDVMKNFLWKGQCSCPYWHGVFGGLYLPFLREANYTNLIMAENTASRILRKGLPQIFRSDFDHDGEEELIAETKDLNVYFKPSQGAGIFEIDYKPKALNLQDVLSRKPEAYHKNITSFFRKEKGEHISIHEIDKKANFDVSKALIYDEYQRNSFLLRLMESFKEEMVRDGKRGDYGDLMTGRYSLADVINRKGKIAITFQKDAVFSNAHFNILKKIFLNKKGSVIEYEIEIFLKYGVWHGYAGIEFCISVLDADFIRRRDEFSIIDRNRKLELNFIARPAALWWSGLLETVSQSETSYELIPQGTIIFPYWEINLKEGEKANLYLAENIT